MQPPRWACHGHLPTWFPKQRNKPGRCTTSLLVPKHLLLAMTQVAGPTRDLLARYGLNATTVLQALAQIRGSQRVTSQNPEATYQALEKYGRDLTTLARQGKLDPVIGRDKEIRRVIQILSRRTKNNPVLVGDPGVGKTAIVEGLAQRIIKGDVPEGLKKQACDRPGYGRIDRRRQVPGRVRGAPSRQCSRKSPTASAW